MAEGSQFNFWAPGQVDTSGVQQGAASLLAGGQAKAQGIAAAGEATAAAYTSIGNSIAGGIEKKAAEKKKEQLSSDVSAYLDASMDKTQYQETTSLDIEGTEDPELAQMYREFQAMDGDPDANMSTLLGKISKHFETGYGKTKENAALSAKNIMAERTEFIMTPKQRGAMMKTRADLLMRGVPAGALSSLADGRNMSGYYPDESSRRQTNTDRIRQDYQFMTPAQKSRVAIAQSDALAVTKENRVRQAEAKNEEAMAELLSVPILMPNPVGGNGIPTGMRQPRGAETFSVEEVLGGSEQFLSRSNEAGSAYPTGPITKRMSERRKVQFIGRARAAEYRKLLRGSIPESGLDDEMKRRGIFASRQDPSFREWVGEIRSNIDKDTLPPEFAKGAPRDKFTNIQEQSYTKFESELARSETNDLRRNQISLGEMQSIEWAGAMGSDNQRDGQNKILWPKVSISLVNGEPVFTPDSGDISPTQRKSLQKMFGSKTAKGELAMRLALGHSRETLKPGDINTRLAMMEDRNSSGYAAMMRGESTGTANPDPLEAPEAPRAPADPQVDPNQTPAEQAIVDRINKSRSERAAANDPTASYELPTDRSMQAAAAKRAGLPDHHGNAVARIGDLERVLEGIDVSGDATQRAFGEAEWKKLSDMYGRGEMEAAAKQAEKMIRWAKTRKKRN